MKFVHIADMHFDAPFVNLSDKGVMGDLRRLEQRKVLRKIVDYIKKNDVEHFFISGDLYEHQTIKQSTIEFINNLFSEIPKTKIWIAPGNHDPNLKNSYYGQFNWNENVTIFSSLEKVTLDNMNIYGFGFQDFYCLNSGIEEIEIDEPDKLNILIIHASLDASADEEREYNPIKKSLLEEKGFDYIALGHIHKPNFDTKENQRICYPGSTLSLGFDELGSHGMIVGDLSKESISLEFIPFENDIFKEIPIDITNISSKEDLIEMLNSIEIKEGQFIKIILVGNRQFEINIQELLKFISNEAVLKIKNQTKIAIDLDKIANETTLRGLFIKEMKEIMQDEEISLEEKEKIEKAIEIGLEALE